MLKTVRPLSSGCSMVDDLSSASGSKAALSIDQVACERRPCQNPFIFRWKLHALTARIIETVVGSKVDFAIVRRPAGFQLTPSRYHLITGVCSIEFGVYGSRASVDGDRTTSADGRRVHVDTATVGVLETSLSVIERVED